MEHVVVSENVKKAVKAFLEDRREKGLTTETKTAQEAAEQLARQIFGNVQRTPLFAITVEGQSLRPFLTDTLVVPPIMHIQVRDVFARLYIVFVTT